MNCPGITPASWKMRVLLGLDTLGQLLLRDGVPGVTISSRAGTATAHSVPRGQKGYWRHAWGRWLFYLLDHCWPFGKDADGTSHCCSAFRGDIGRNIAGLWEILGDPVVVEFGNLHGFEPEIQEALQKRAKRIET